MITGTAHFPTVAHARAYYRPQEGENTTRAVREKIAEKSIYIGKPSVKPGHTLIIKDHRYHIDDNQP